MTNDEYWYERLSRDEAWSLLESVPVGRLVFIKNSSPAIKMANFITVERTIYIGVTLTPSSIAALAVSPVSFEVDDYDISQRSGWCVIVTGTVTVPPAAERPSIVENWLPHPRATMLRLAPSGVNGHLLLNDRRALVSERSAPQQFSTSIVQRRYP